MNTLFRFFLLLILSGGASLSLSAQSPAKKVVETAFSVSGVCEQCKARIESTLDIKGVKFASWDQKTQLLTLAYQPKKISEDQIHTLLAEAGHKTERVEARPEAYAKLPGCCKYEQVDSH